jgi:thymidylate synthase ThyX
MPESFSSTEEKNLAPFFTNLDKSVFGLILPQEVAGALFSRYSRSTKSLRRTFLDEFLGDPDLALADLLGGQRPGNEQNAALKKARAFYERVLVGYGDDSVAQLGAAHIACEEISNVAVKILEDARIGMAPLEKSTRYVRFDHKDEEGNYLFYREPVIMASPHRDDYLATLDLLFETYSRQIEPMIEFVRSSLPIERIELRHPQTGEPMTYGAAQKDEKLKKWAEIGYRSTVRAHACDVLRGYLPAATLTNAGFFGVGQAFEYLLTKLYSHDLAEAKNLAVSLHEELNKMIPSFVKRARSSEYLAAAASTSRSLAKRLFREAPAWESEAVTLLDYDRDAEEKIIAAVLYPHSELPLEQVRRTVAGLSDEERRNVLEAYWSGRRNRRDKPGRALEQVYYTFDVLGNLGAYRDLQRHRMLSQERQDFTTVHGYDTPAEIAEAGFKADFDRCMEKAAELHERIYRDHPVEAQYVVPFAFRIRWYMKMNLREAVHIGELRTMPQGHPDYRLITQKMWRKIGEVHPALAQAAKFVDWNTYRLGRFQSEMRSEYKKSALE